MLPLFDENPTSRKPFVTWALIYLCVVAFVVPRVGDDAPVALPDTATSSAALPDDVAFQVRLAAIPCEIIHGRPLTVDEVVDTYVTAGNSGTCRDQPVGEPLYATKRVSLAIVSSLFLHGGFVHLGLNLLFLWVFGNNVEDRLGHLAFVVFYLLAGVVGTISYVAAQPESAVAIVGASASVAGVMGAYLVWYPDAPIRTLLFLVLVDIRARWFLVAWFAVQFFTAPAPGAWIAHVAGFTFGVIAGRIIRTIQPRLRLRPGQPEPSWDATGGAGHGPYPHLDEVWIEPHNEHYLEAYPPPETPATNRPRWRRPGR